MHYQEFRPCSMLKDHVQCYFICQTDNTAAVEDKVYATGAVEIMFKMDGETTIGINNDILNEPLIQLWGQVVQPITLTSFGKHSMFGIRFFAHTASCFLNEPVEQFNEGFFDLKDIVGNEAVLLHSQMLGTSLVNERIKLVESFLLERLLRFGKKYNKVNLLQAVMNEIRQEDFFDNINNVAARYNISSRYLQKIFLQYLGITPKLFSKINRFQKSLQLVSAKESSLTSVAHHCGYFDQSHFIKDFKYFTGTTPSGFNFETSSELLAILNN